MKTRNIPALIVMLAVIMQMTMVASAVSNFEKIGENNFADGGNIYKLEHYLATHNSGLYDKNEIIVAVKCKNGECPNTVENLIVLGPGDTMNGAFAFAGGESPYYFSKSAAKKILDGKIGEAFSGNLSEEFSDKLSENVGVLIIDKVRASYVERNLADYSFTENWSLGLYANDYEADINFAVETLKAKKVAFVGHSRSGAIFANITNRISKIRVDQRPYKLLGPVFIESGILYEPGSEEYLNALATLQAEKDYMNAGNYIGDSSALFDILNAAQYDSVMYYTALYLLGNTDQLPGPLTPVTGLSDSWYLNRYATIKDDFSGLKYTDINYLFYTLNNGGFYPIIPLRLDINTLEMQTSGGPDGSGSRLDNIENWTRTGTKTNFIVGENGFGKYVNSFYYTARITDAHLSVVADNGHLDVLNLKE